jgi:hypothetical protein
VASGEKDAMLFVIGWILKNPVVVVFEGVHLSPIVVGRVHLSPFMVGMAESHTCTILVLL